MLKKILFHLLVLVLAVVAGASLATHLRERQDAVCKSRGQLSHAPIAGFHKLLADLKWIQFIQHCGSISKMDEAQAEEVNGMLQELLQLDPDFGKGYKTGALMISTEAPSKALVILETGAANPMLKSNWEIPYLAGFIHMRQIKGSSEGDLAHARKAKVYFQQALDANSSQTYILSSLIRAEAILDKNKPKKLAELEAWFAYLESQANGSIMVPGGFGVSATLPPVSGRFGGIRSPLGNGLIGDQKVILHRIVKLAQQCRTELPNDPNAMKTTAAIIGKLQADMHLCTVCYTPYVAGDKFCGGCGKAVAAYGACAKCGEVGSSAFCTHCGNPNAAKP